ncbi:hypothetical protein GGI20_001133 [Coemansia sp. BCRC 34301]|nr:hypothetical protein GGI20_001133 [Coemansia sp. BCRC 34301]
MQYARSNDDYYSRVQQHNRSSSSSNPSPGPQPYGIGYPRPEQALSPGSAPVPQQRVAYEYPEVMGGGGGGQQRPPPLPNSHSDPPIHGNTTANGNRPRASLDSVSPPVYHHHPQSAPNNMHYGAPGYVPATRYTSPSYSPQQMLSPTQQPPMATNIPAPLMYARPVQQQAYYTSPQAPMSQPKHDRHSGYHHRTSGGNGQAPSLPPQYISPPRFMPARPPVMSATPPAQMQAPALHAKHSFGQQQPQMIAKWPGSQQKPQHQSAGGSYHGGQYNYPPVQAQQQRRPSSTESQNGGANNVSASMIAYLRSWQRKCERTKFTTLMHCLEPVSLVDRLGSSASNAPSPRGNLLPLFKASEDWIAPTVGLPLENRPGYRCLLYIVDGALLYDNGLSGEKLLSKGTLHLSTTTKDANTYVRNPSQTHRAHIIRLWIETNDHHGRAMARTYPDFSYKIRHIADSDMQNCLLTIAQPANYHPSFGMTARIYGPFMPTPQADKKDKTGVEESALTHSRPGAVSPLESAYYMSQSVLFTRPEYFTPEPPDFLDSVEMNSSGGGKEWGVTDAELMSRVCVDPLLVNEDVFISVCTLDCDTRIVYEPYDLHDEDRRMKSSNAGRGSRRRLWVQTLQADFNPEATANSGRLVINGDRSGRMRPGDSMFIRRIEMTEKVVMENCGRAPIEFMVVETPY